MKKRVVFTLIILLVAAAAAGGVRVLGGELSVRGAQRAWNVLAGGAAEADFYFEPGLNEVFADVDGTVIAAGGTGFAVYDKRGVELNRAGFSMKTPAIASGGGIAVVYDIGGRAARIVYADGSVTELSLANEIVSVSVGRGGGFAVCTSEDGEYKGKAAFYKMRSGEPTLVYEWFSGEGYVLGAAVSPNGKRFAVNTLNPRGGRIVFLAAGDDKVAAEYIHAGGAILEIGFEKGGRLIARTSGEVLIINADGSTASAVDFAGGSPDGYSADGDGFLAVHLTTAQGAGGELVTYDLKGRETARLKTSRRLVSLTANGNRIAALWSDGLDIFDGNLRLVASYPDASGSGFAFARGFDAAVVMNGRDGNSFARQNSLTGEEG